MESNPSSRLTTSKHKMSNSHGKHLLIERQDPTRLHSSTCRPVNVESTLKLFFFQKETHLSGVSGGEEAKILNIEKEGRKETFHIEVGGSLCDLPGYDAAAPLGARTRTSPFLVVLQFRPPFEFALIL